MLTTFTALSFIFLTIFFRRRRQTVPTTRNRTIKCKWIAEENHTSTFERESCMARFLSSLLSWKSLPEKKFLQLFLIRVTLVKLMTWQNHQDKPPTVRISKCSGLQGFGPPKVPPPPKEGFIIRLSDDKVQRTAMWVYIRIAKRLYYYYCPGLECTCVKLRWFAFTLVGIRLVRKSAQVFHLLATQRKTLCKFNLRPTCAAV